MESEKPPCFADCGKFAEAFEIRFFWIFPQGKKYGKLCILPSNGEMYTKWKQILPQNGVFPWMWKSYPLFVHRVSIGFPMTTCRFQARQSAVWQGFAGFSTISPTPNTTATTFSYSFISSLSRPCGGACAGARKQRDI